MSVDLTPAALIDPLLTLSATEAVAALRAGDHSSTELVRAVLHRIEVVNPSVNAIRATLAAEALAAAAEADDRLRRGEPRGVLDGLPVTVKDNIDVAGSATTHGCAALAGAVATTDAPVVANLRAAGAIPVARTNMPDFALRWHTDSGLLGATVNPWDPTLTPGGSSGGEAVALATGMSLLGVGTDLGGSLRWPSQCAGTAALRPTQGRVPDTPEQLKAPGLRLLDTHGPMARRVEDLRLAFSVMAAPDPRDPWNAPVAADYVPTVPRTVHVLRAMAGVEYDPAVRLGLERAAGALTDAGYRVLDDPPPGLGDRRAGETWAGLMAADARRVWPELGPLASAGGRRFMELMFGLVPPVDQAGYAELFVTRDRLARSWAVYQARTPLVLAPVHAGAPFAAGADLDGPAAADRIVDSLRATLVVNLLGLPSVAVPAGLHDGLPVGVQVIGPRFGDELCLRAAAVIEEVIGAATGNGLARITPIEPVAART
ncbi:MAG TPA: amidase [Pseudonocardia sp.]|nr:amidase [Pseudonocardia sp.]